MTEPVSVIINVFNEAPTIEAEIRAIYATIVGRLPGSQLIVAEDGSTDGTKEIIARLIGELGIVHSTSLQRKGYALALRDAMGLATCPWIFFSDTGGKNDFADFWKLYEARQGAALVIGGRLGRSDQLYRRLLSWGYGQLLRVYFGLPRLDADSGFRLYATSLAKALVGQEWINSHLVASELVLRIHAMGGEIRQIPVTYRQRQGISRGLPAKNIPGVILSIMRNMPALKRACARLRRGRQDPAMPDIQGKITVAMIARNEEAAVGKVIGEIKAALPGARILIVDSSEDRTAEIARRLGATVLIQYPPRGYGRAMDLALRSAETEAVVTMDCDDTYPVDRIEPLARMIIEQGYDLVDGCRLQGKPANMPWPNYLGNWLFALIASLLFARRIRDLHSGMRAYRKGVAASLDYNLNGAAQPVDLLLGPLRRGMKVGFVPIPYLERLGESVMNPLQTSLWTLRRIFTARFANPKER